MLALPSPSEILGPEEGGWQSWFSWRAWVKTGKTFIRGSKGGSRRPGRVLGLKLLRSSLLVVKVLTIPRLCTDPTTSPRPVVAGFLLALAVADTVVDHRDFVMPRSRRGSFKAGQGTRGLSRSDDFRNTQIGGLGSGIWLSLGLAALHFGVLGLNALGGRSYGTHDGVLGEIWSKACCVDRH